MSSRIPLFVGNWKMYKTPAQTRAYVEVFREPASAFGDRVSIALAAPFVDLEALKGAVGGTSIGVAAQDCYWEPEGAFTGAVSAAMLGAMRVNYCIVGHSERRRLFGDTDETVARKIDALVAEDVRPIVCVGETLEEKREGRTRERVTTQVVRALEHLDVAQLRRIIVAYEPVWAIGTGLADDPSTANKTVAFIRAALGGLDEALVLYGGSMKPDNARAFCEQPNINGGLVGSASLDPLAFCALIAEGVRAYE